MRDLAPAVRRAVEHEERLVRRAAEAFALEPDARPVNLDASTLAGDVVELHAVGDDLNRCPAACYVVGPRGRLTRMPDPEARRRWRALTLEMYAADRAELAKDPTSRWARGAVADRVVARAREAARRDDGDGLYHLLDGALNGAATKDLLAVLDLLANHGPPALLSRLDEHGEEMLEGTYAEIDDDERASANVAA